jgi:F-type H+-transporting ATPase subunit a
VKLSPDEIILWSAGPVHINLTLVTTWALIAILAFGSWMVTRKLDRPGPRSRWQNLLEMLVLTLERQIAATGLIQARRYLVFLGSLFILIATASLGTILPGYSPPTGSLSTTAALAICVFVAVPYFGIREQGLVNYLKSYARPTPLMLPFNIIGELSRTLALAVRLFGNMMSGAMIIAILLSIAPLIFPVLMTVLGLITGMVQAYIFAVLAAGYIAAATLAQQNEPSRRKRRQDKKEAES